MAYSLKLLYSNVKYQFNAILHDFNMLVMMYKRWSLYGIVSNISVLQSELPFQCNITWFQQASHVDRGQCTLVTSFIHCDVTALPSRTCWRWQHKLWNCETYQERTWISRFVDKLSESCQSTCATERWPVNRFLQYYLDNQPNKVRSCRISINSRSKDKRFGFILLKDLLQYNYKNW